MYNSIHILGRLTADPDLRYTAQGTPVANFRVASDSGYGDKKQTLFIDCVAWNKQGEACAQYLNKGSLVFVDGRLEERSWESDGHKRSKMEVVASQVKFLNTKADSQAPPEETSDIEPF
jgi:single-strand DNA-binding protein